MKAGVASAADSAEKVDVKLTRGVLAHGGGGGIAGGGGALGAM